MGMNITGLLLENEHLELRDIEEFLKLELNKKRVSPWLDCEAGVDESDEILIIFKNNSVLLLFDFDLFAEREKELSTLAMLSKSGLLFGCSETSMTFVFDWFEFQKHLGQDAYTFEGDFQAHGENKLNLTEDDDTIQDGLFPYIQKQLGGVTEDEECQIYSFKLNDKSAKNKNTSSQQSNVESTSNPLILEDIKSHLRNIIAEKKPDNAFDIFSSLISLISEDQDDFAKFINLDKSHHEKTVSKDLKIEMVKWIENLKKRPLTKWEAIGELSPILFELSRRPFVDLNDIKSGSFKAKKTWQFWK
jgi:hypothetical protein